MVYAVHQKLTFSGVFGSAASPEEIWECNVNVVADTGGIPDMETDAGGASTAFQDQIMPFLADDVVLTNTRSAVIGTDGRVERDPFTDAYIQADHPSDVTGAVTGDFHPLQTALVISLVTARPGATGRGRFYLPLVKQALDSAHILSVAAATDWAGAAALFMSQLASTVQIPIVASSKGYNTTVTGVRVGRVPDTQRRRRGDLNEGYVFSSI